MGPMADVPKHPLPAVLANGGPGWAYARGGLSGTEVARVWISTKGSANCACGAGATVARWFSPTRATLLQHAAQILQVWSVSGDASGTTSALWPCMAAWSWGVSVAAVADAEACTCCIPTPQKSMEAAAKPCIGTAAIRSQAKKILNLSIVVGFYALQLVPLINWYSHKCGAAGRVKSAGLTLCPFSAQG
jgi:hypothetical protein